MSANEWTEPPWQTALDTQREIVKTLQEIRDRLPAPPAPSLEAVLRKVEEQQRCICGAYIRKECPVHGGKFEMVDPAMEMQGQRPERVERWFEDAQRWRWVRAHWYNICTDTSATDDLNNIRKVNRLWLVMGEVKADEASLDAAVDKAREETP